MPGLSATLQQWLNVLAPRTTRAPDGLPFPPAKLIHTVAGTKDNEWFWQGGQLGAKALVEILARRDLRLSELRAILDFGCGCGRVIRHVAPLASAARLSGSDYNPALVRWCRRSLPLADFSLNELAPPTQYADGQFDLVYAFSVFTHLTEPLQFAWIKDLRRIVRPGGYLVITTHGERYAEKLSAEERVRFARGDVVVWSADSVGKNRCATFHPPAYVRDKLAPSADLNVLEFVSEGALGNPHQDAWLMQRPA